MLYVNNQELKPGMPEWTRYKKFLDEVLPDLPETVIFKRKRPIMVNEGTKLTEVDPRTFIPYEAIDYDKELGSQHWRYCETAPVKNERGKWIYKPLGKNDFKRSYAVDKAKRPDFIFFMMELCHKTKDGTVIFEDRKAEARKRIAKDDKANAVKFMITNSMSPLSPENSGSEDMLRMIAAAWGVPHAHNQRKSLDEVRVELLDIVEIAEKKADSERGFDTFLSEINSKERIVLRANIQRAIDKKTISYDSKEFTWKYEGTDHLIVTISTRFFKSPASGLFEYFLTNEDKKRVFYQILEDKYEVKDVFEEPEVEEPTEKHVEKSPQRKAFDLAELEKMDSEELKAEIESYNYWDVVKWGEQVLNLELKGKKKPQVIADIVGYFAAKKLQHVE